MNELGAEFFTNNMTIKLGVFSPLMKSGIVSRENNGFAITKHRCRLGEGDLEIMKKIL